MIKIQRLNKDGDSVVTVGEYEDGGHSVYMYKRKSKDYKNRAWEIDKALVTTIMPYTEGLLFVVIREMETRAEFRIPYDVAVAVGVDVEVETGVGLSVGIDYWGVNGKAAKERVESAAAVKWKKDREDRKREKEVYEHEKKYGKKYKMEIDGEEVELDADAPF